MEAVGPSVVVVYWMLVAPSGARLQRKYVVREDAIEMAKRLEANHRERGEDVHYQIRGYNSHGKLVYR